MRTTQGPITCEVYMGCAGRLPSITIASTSACKSRRCTVCNIAPIMLRILSARMRRRGHTPRLLAGCRGCGMVPLHEGIATLDSVLGGTTCLMRRHSVLCVFRRVKGHHTLLQDSPLLKKTCLRQVALDTGFHLTHTHVRPDGR